MDIDEKKDAEHLYLTFSNWLIRRISYKIQKLPD